MKRKIIMISISILLILGIILSINSAPKNKIYLNKNNIKENNKSLAIYLEQENGSYSKTTTFPSKSDKYVLNKSKSVCNGNTNISWDSEEWGLELSNIDREETKCFLYFDKGKTIDDIIPTLNAKTETPDFSQIATEDEGVFITDDPMYGTNAKTYYWRGAATTNYLKFANFCWRIVRINGDKTLRLIYDGTTCHQNGESTTDSIAVQNVAYNIVSNRSEYVGWTYSTGSQRTTSGSASNIKSQTDTWYNNNIGNNTTYSSHVADGKFCNDRNTGSGYSWSSLPSSTFYYAGYDRSGAKSASSVTPTLACGNSGDVYTLKAGAIAMDEIVMAGAKWETPNNNYYIYNGNNYWSMSPCIWNDSDALMFYLWNDGQLEWNGVFNTRGIRPVINLNSDVILSGDGTIDSPYEVF